jgi:hypothetical protein
MLVRLVVSATLLLGVFVSAGQNIDREAYARDYVQFQVLQLNQWSQEFPQQFYANLMRPPIDAGKLSAAAKASAGELGDAVKMMAALSNSKDVLSNAEFRTELEKALTVSKELNQVMSTQRFPAPVQSSWDQMRAVLNNLARVYKLDAVLEAPKGGSSAPKVAPPGGLAGYIVDVSCAKRGKGMWANAECVARCVRDGDKVVLVTEEGKVYQISNQDKIAPESYGQAVTLTGKTEGDTITVDTLKM